MAETADQEKIVDVTIKNVLDEVSKVWQENKTPLILSESGLMDRFYTHRDANIIDAKSLFLREKIQHMPLEDLMEEMRQKLVNSMKYGKPLVIAMQNSAADLMGRYHGKQTFPVPEVFIPKQITDELVWNKFVKEEDKHYPNTNVKHFTVKPEFQVIITSQFSVEDHQEFLQQSLPLQHCKVLRLTE